jgi:hypothetical protein
LYGWVEKSVSDILTLKRKNNVICLGIDGCETDQWAKDQIGVAIVKKGFLAIGRKFHPTKEEAKYVVKAPDYLFKEENYERIFKFNGKKFFICACYDSFGLKHERIHNPGVDAVLDLVHGFRPKGEGGSSDVYFAKNGFAGASKQWNCPVFGAGVFFKRRIPERWPSGVIWNQGKLSTKLWRYDFNPLNPTTEIKHDTKEGIAKIRVFQI